ncbi:hypothetical protein CaCOL14_010629 [Colletotrichum acutatum]
MKRSLRTRTREMKHEVLDPVDEGDNANTNLAAADIANTNNKANAPAPTSWAWLARVSTPLPTLYMDSLLLPQSKMLHQLAASIDRPMATDIPHQPLAPRSQL